MLIDKDDIKNFEFAESISNENVRQTFISSATCLMVDLVHEGFSKGDAKRYLQMLIDRKVI